MKKLQICCLLGLVAVCLFPSTASADLAEQQQKPIIASHTGSTPEDEEVISVDFAWGSLAFTFKENRMWDPKTHTYEEAVTAKWLTDKGGDQFTITNHSNAAVNAQVEVSTAEDFKGNLTISADKNEIALPSAAEGSSLNDPKNAPSETVALTINGTLAPTVTESTIIGHVTVHVN